MSIVKEPVSADINNSSLSGLWVDKDGTVFSQREEGYELKKVSEETDFPTDEIKRRFDSYCKRLKEYERSSVISNADIYVTQKKQHLMLCFHLTKRQNPRNVQQVRKQLQNVHSIQCVIFVLSRYRNTIVVFYRTPDRFIRKSYYIN